VKIVDLASQGFTTYTLNCMILLLIMYGAMIKLWFTTKSVQVGIACRGNLKFRETTSNPKMYKTETKKNH